MIRLGLIADIHGNLPALEAIVQAAGDVDAWICAGDIAGHLPFVDEVVERLQSIKAYCVKGNHDEALVKGLAIPSSSAATRALQLQRRWVSSATRQWLSQLPETLDLNFEGHKVTVMHGGPKDPLHHRVKEVTDDVRSFAEGRTVVLGHAHRKIEAVDETYAVLNPGSAGLPTGGEVVGRALVFEFPSRKVREIVAPYETDTLLSKLSEVGYDERYANCLKEGQWVGFSGTGPKLPLIIVGASVYGTMVAELAAGNPGIEVLGFVDDAPEMIGASIEGYPVLGRLSDLSKLADRHGVTDVAVAIGDNRRRENISALVKQQGVRLAKLVHPSATVSESAQIEQGVIIDAQSYIGPDCVLEEGVSIWPGVTVSHHTRIGRYAAIKPGATIGGHSKIAEKTKVDIGAVIPSYSEIADDL